MLMYPLLLDILNNTFVICIVFLCVDEPTQINNGRTFQWNHKTNMIYSLKLWYPHCSMVFVFSSTWKQKHLSPKTILVSPTSQPKKNMPQNLNQAPK